MNDDTCLRCGQCCYLIKEGKVTDVPCPFLIFQDDGLTACRIYKNRIGRRLPYNAYCGFRRNSKFDYAGCIYNTNKKIVKVNVHKKV